MAENSACPEVDPAHLHGLTDGDRLGRHGREHTERDNEGVDEHSRQVNGAQGGFHLADSRRAIDVEGDAESREETRKPVEDRTARADHEHRATRRAHGLEPGDEKGRAETECVAHQAPEPHACSCSAADLPRERGHCEQLDREKRGRGARTHDKRVEDEEGEELCARIEPARRLAGGGLGG